MIDDPKRPCVYILASGRNGTLYTGVTSDIIGRAWVHKSDAVEGFTKRYEVHRLVYFEFHETMSDAIVREKQIKKWRRSWKLELIEKTKPAMAKPLRDAFELRPLDPRFRGGDGLIRRGGPGS